MYDMTYIRTAEAPYLMYQIKLPISVHLDSHIQSDFQVFEKDMSGFLYIVFMNMFSCF